MRRRLVGATYKPPQIARVEDLIPVIERNFGDYRRVYIEQPRVRLDGVYIAVCHYVYVLILQERRLLFDGVLFLQPTWPQREFLGQCQSPRTISLLFLNCNLQVNHLITYHRYL